MSEEEDFDIVPDDEGVAPRSTWLWISIITVVALFAFGVGAAFMILSDRMGGDSPDPTPTVDPAVVAPTPVAAITGTATITANITVTVSGTPSGTPTITGTPSPSPTPTTFCTQQVEPQFVTYFDQAQLGCATNAPAVVWAAFQSFERGSMLWRSDRDTSYVFFSSGSWFPITEGWDGGPAADRGAPPPGLQTPQRGFGFVWSHNDEIFNGLGWARDQEKGFCAVVQEFERGFILHSTAVNSCTPDNLYNFATAGDWTPLIIAAVTDAQWRNSPATPSSVTTPIPTPVTPVTTPTLQGGGPPPGGTTRPTPNGVFDARNATGYTIDGNFDEWPPNAWLPLNNLVFGADNHSGPGDLSANFQVGWNANGLLLAIRVNDDSYHVGPAGSNLWQGDSIEIQFDRQLAEDYDSNVADADDYQIGLAYDDNAGVTRGYHWLPFDHEKELGLPSAVTFTQQGYQIEMVVPWYVFDITTPDTGIAYGFNVSVNDNDSDNPAQESVLSASPARTTHDNPTEWGTLRLFP